MNISDKEKFYSELSRVLKPNGRLVFHDIFGTDNTPHYPTPWAEHDSMSSLCTQDKARESIEKSNLVIDEWIDKSKLSMDFFKEMVNKVESSGPPPLGFHLLMGTTAKEKLMNQARNLEENRVTIVQGTAIKS
jgi:ubiquinone/menaquinone biosynthesis C-methylase UbiE